MWVEACNRGHDTSICNETTPIGAAKQGQMFVTGNPTTAWVEGWHLARFSIMNTLNAVIDGKPIDDDDNNRSP